MTRFRKILILGVITVVFTTVGFVVLGSGQQYKEHNEVSAEKVAKGVENTFSDF